MEPVSGTPRRGVLAATVVSLAVLPVLVLSNLEAAPARAGVAATGDDARLATSDAAPSPAGAGLATSSRLVLDQVLAATDNALVVMPQQRSLAHALIEPVEVAGFSAAVAETTTTAAPPTTSRAPATTRPRATTTTAPPVTTVPSTTSAPPTSVPPTTTAPPATAPPTTAPPATAPPTTAPPTTAPPTTGPPTTSPPGQTIFGQPYQATWPALDMWERLSICESGGNWAINTGNGYYGGLQFSLGSWQWVGGQGSPADASREEQIYRANLLWEKQGWGGWPGNF